MMAIEMEKADVVDALVAMLLDRGYISFYFLSTRNAFRIAPPLLISHEEIQDACSAIESCLDKL